MPETWLPWSKDDKQGINGSPQHWVATSASFLWLDDREYAIHAANCLPQLVAALNEVFDRIEDDDAWTTRTSKSQIIEKARAALEAAKGGE